MKASGTMNGQRQGFPVPPIDFDLEGVRLSFWIVEHYADAYPNYPSITFELEGRRLPMRAMRVVVIE